MRPASKRPRGWRPAQRPGWSAACGACSTAVGGGHEAAARSSTAAQLAPRLVRPARAPGGKQLSSRLIPPLAGELLGAHPALMQARLARGAMLAMIPSHRAMPAACRLITGMIGLVPAAGWRAAAGAARTGLKDACLQMPPPATEPAVGSPGRQPGAQLPGSGSAGSPGRAGLVALLVGRRSARVSNKVRRSRGLKEGAMTSIAARWLASSRPMVSGRGGNWEV